VTVTGFRGFSEFRFLGKPLAGLPKNRSADNRRSPQISIISGLDDHN